jgi:hypothetical protein
MGLTVLPGLSLGKPKPITISSGVIDISNLSGSFITVDTESAAASDDLDTITLTSSHDTDKGGLIILQAADSGRTVVVKDGTGNLKLNSDFSLDNVEDKIFLIKVGENFEELTRSSNGA